MTWTPYQAEVLRVVDGDTLVLDLDLGCRMHLVGLSVRLADLNAPELGTPAGDSARGFVEGWVKTASRTLHVTTDKPDARDKFGRWLVRLTSADGRCLNDDLIAASHAVRWNGRGART